jgi:hypothetical protein
VIVDAFLANDEQELVQLRISYLSPTVDVVYIGEAVETFSGKNKKLTFEPLSDGKRIFHIPIPKAPSNIEPSDRWNREEFQRDYFLKQIQRFTSPKDIVLFCDVDEIPSRDQIREVEELLLAHTTDYVNLVTPIFLRNLNWSFPAHELWAKAKAFQSHAGFPRIRYGNGAFTTRSHGAHFSYLGRDADTMKKKYSDFSHSELDKPVASDPALLEMADQFGVSHVGSFGAAGSGAVSVDWGLLSAIKVEEFSELQLFALEFFDGKLGSSQFNELPKIERMAASRRITSAIRKYDLNRLTNKGRALESALVLFAMVSTHLGPRIDSFLASGGRVLSYLPGGNLVRRGYRRFMQWVNQGN